METANVVAALSALAQETRLAIFRLLVRTGPGGLPAGVIAKEVGVVASTLSHHLALLEQARLVRSARQGRNVIYSSDVDGIRSLLLFLAEDCCEGRPDLGGDLRSLVLGNAAE
ncbi:MAG: metalloregulator ArsR/SmtB family transcription factor [Alphaproteobacteria bacterium]|nr:metalloregulator ArsR/SmtB family transcription factor [Alphaproteobacteria bacterium]